MNMFVMLYSRTLYYLDLRLTIDGFARVSGVVSA